MNSAALKQRRKNIALAISYGHTPAEISKSYDVTTTTIRGACNENDVDYPGGQVRGKAKKVEPSKCSRCGYVWAFVPRNGRTICEICMYSS